MRLALLLIVTCAQVSAGGLMVDPNRFAAAGGACNSTLQDWGANAQQGAYTSTDPTKYYQGMYFVAGSTGTACSTDLSIKLGQGPFSFYVSIWSDNAGVPGSIIGSEGGPFSTAGLSGSFTTNNYALSASLTSGTTYWLVIRSTGISGSTYMYVAVDSNLGALPSQRSADGSTWTGDGGNYGVAMKVYK